MLTQNYADFCEKAFGKFLHHTLHSASDAAQCASLARTYGLSAAFVGGAALLGVAGVAGLAGVADAAAVRGRDLLDLDQTLGVPGGNRYTADELGEFEKRYQHQQASSDGSGGRAGGASVGQHSGDGSSGSDGGGGDGGGGGCGGGCGS